MRTRKAAGRRGAGTRSAGGTTTDGSKGRRPLLGLDQEQRGKLLGLMPLSLAIFVLLYYLLIHFGGGWNILANTRGLLLVLRGGIVALTDMDQGFIYGLPDQGLLRQAEEPIHWELIFVAVLTFVAYFLLRGYQFHLFAKFCAIPGRVGDHIRAYLYGEGVNRFLPFNVGNVATASALEGMGAPLQRAALAVYMGRIFLVFEVAIFMFVALTEVGWSVWYRILFWSLIVLAGSYALTRGVLRARREGPRPLAIVSQLWKPLSRDPWAMTRMIAISLGSFLLEMAAVYTIASAFTAGEVLLHVNLWVLMMGLVAGSIARLIPITPGGLGQYEWGFAAALYIGGVGLPESVTIAILSSFFRYVTTSLLFLGATYWKEGVPTSLGRALELFFGQAGARSRARSA